MMNKYSRPFVNFFESNTSEVSRKRKYSTTQTVKVVHHFCSRHCGFPMKGMKDRDVFFTRDEEDDTKWTCRCGKIRKVKMWHMYKVVTQKLMQSLLELMDRLNSPWPVLDLIEILLEKFYYFLPSLFESMDLSILWFLDCFHFLS